MVGSTITGTAPIAAQWDRRTSAARASVHVDARGAAVAFAGVTVLTMLAPFERTRPLVQLPGQSISNLEAAVLAVLLVWGVALISARRLPQWRTPVTFPWLALLAAMSIASVAAPTARVNALHMTGRIAAAFAIFLLTVNGVRTRARLVGAAALGLGAAVAVSVLVVLEFQRIPAVIEGLKAFRPFVTLVGTQIRAGGPLQYPTIASMYLEVTFACGVGLLLAAVDTVRRGTAAVLFAALLFVAYAVTLTFTRAGLLSIAAALAFVGAVRYRGRGVEAGGRLIAALAIGVAALFFASRSTASMWLRFTTEGQESWYRVAVQAPDDLLIGTGATLAIPVTLTNTGRVPWDSDAESPFFLSYHWMKADEDRYVVFEGLRTRFEQPVAAGDTVTLNATIRAPQQPGEFRLAWDIVLEHRLWFSTEPGAVAAVSRVRVEGPPPAASAPLRSQPLRRPPVRPGRLVLWRAAARMIAARPFLGVGPDNFRLLYADYARLPASDPRMHSNNMYIEMLAGAGLVGGVAFLWLISRAARMFAAGVSTLSRGGDPVATGIAAAGIAIGLHALVDSFLAFAPIYVLFATTLGLAAACARAAERGAHADRI
jgi:O-antigen ligase